MDVDELSQYMEKEKIMRTALWLSGKGLVDIIENKESIAVLTEEGEKVLEKDLPERRIAKYLKENNLDSIPIKDLKNILDKDEINAALGNLKKKGIAKIEKGNIVFLIGETKSEFGGSLYLKEIADEVRGDTPDINYENELKLWKLVIEANKQNLLKSAKDLNVGGLAVALGKIVAKTGFGFSTKPNLGVNIFSETASRAIVEVPPHQKNSFLKLAQAIQIPVFELGTVGNSEKFEIDDVQMEISELKKIYFETFPEILKQEI